MTELVRLFLNGGTSVNYLWIQKFCMDNSKEINDKSVSCICTIMTTMLDRLKSETKVNVQPTVNTDVTQRPKRVKSFQTLKKSE